MNKFKGALPTATLWSASLLSVALLTACGPKDPPARAPRAGATLAQPVEPAPRAKPEASKTFEQELEEFAAVVAKICDGVSIKKTGGGR